MTICHVLVDFENIQPDAAALSFLNLEGIEIRIFVGAKQNLDVERVSALQPLGDRVKYIKCNAGKNALDFHLAFYLGQLSAAAPDNAFFVVSKDTGYDPLLAYLRKEKIKAKRIEDIAKTFDPKPAKTDPEPPPKTKTKPSPVADKVQSLITKACVDLKKRGNSRPRTVKTLTSTLESVFKSDEEKKRIGAAIDSMTAQGIITLENSKIVSYRLS